MGSPDGGAQQLAAGFVFALDVRGDTVAYATLGDNVVHRTHADGTGPEELFNATTAVNSIAVADKVYFVQPGTFPGTDSVLWQANGAPDGGATNIFSNYYGERVASDGTDVFFADATHNLVYQRFPDGTRTSHSIAPPSPMAFEVDATHLYFAAQDPTDNQPALWRIEKGLDLEPQLVLSNAELGGPTFYVAHVATDATNIYAAVNGPPNALGRILRKAKDGTGTASSVVTFTGTEAPAAIAVDSIAVYFSDVLGSKIRTASKEGVNGNSFLIHSGPSNGLRMVLQGGFLYFYDSNPVNGGVWRLPLN